MTTPIKQIRACIKRAQERGLRIFDDDYGVIAKLDEWRVDARFPVKGVSPIGAVLLIMQPEFIEDETHEGAVARALNTSPPWVDGFADGFQGQPSCTWLNSYQRSLYLAGLEEGYRLRFDHFKRCDCGTVHPTVERCPSCEERSVGADQRSA